jgi:CHAT domain-containing protein
MSITRPFQIFLAVLAGTVVAAGSLFVRRSVIATTPASLIARAYSDDRTLELRISPARHCAVRRQRGQNSSPLDRPQSLLEAEAAIARGLRRNPQDSALLAARGSANLLEWSYEAAITDMEEALDTQPRSTLVLNGLAAAYFERAAAEDRFGDYGTAYELQSRALQQTPNDPVILFNRAVTAARLFLFKQSTQDFERYLSFDSSGEWSDEARQRLHDVKEIVAAHDRRTKTPLLTAAEFGVQINPSDPPTWEKVEPRIEEYLSVAITEWLPAAWPVRGKEPALEGARKSVFVLAAILERRHHDVWLGNLLQEFGANKFPEAIDALSQSLLLNRVTQNFEKARSEAAIAEQLFAEGRNAAGYARARFEEIYALHFLDAGPECARQVQDLLPTISGSRFEWLKLQLRLERFNCATEEGDFGKSQDLSDVATSAQAAGYLATSQRSLGLLAYDSLFLGRIRSGWRLCDEGLRSFWGGTFDPTLGYNLYAAMGSAFEASESWHADRSAADEALTVEKPGHSLVTRAVEHTELAHAAVMAGEPAAAQSSLATANELLAGAATTVTTENYRLTVESYSALVEGQLGDPTTALSRLERMRPQLAHIQNVSILGDFYATSGKLLNIAGRPDAAETELEHSIALAQIARSSLRSDVDRYYWSQQWAEPYLGLIEAKLLQGKGREALDLWELYRASEPDNAASSVGLKTIEAGPAAAAMHLDLARVSERVTQALASLDQQSAIVLVLLPHGAGIWICNERGVTGKMLNVDREAIRLKAGRLNELSSRSSSSLNAILITSNELYQALIEPALDSISTAKNLAFETDDALAALPFQALIDGRGRFLAESHVISYLPRLEFIGGNKGKSGKLDETARALIVAGAGAPDEGLLPLPDAVAEATLVAHRFRQPQLMIGSQASLSAVVSGIGAADLFHFAGHALEGGGHIGLLLGSAHEGTQTQFLSPNSLQKISLPRLRLAVLSACSTEKGSEGTFGGFGSFASVLLEKGVPHVVASRWNVDSASSAVLMSAFYNNLISGVTAPQALASAEADLRRQNAHPYYWAAFDMFGVE